MTTERMLYAAVDAGDAAAYDALADWYDEAGRADAAAGVRKAKATRRRPLRCGAGHFSWLVLPDFVRGAGSFRSDLIVSSPHWGDRFMRPDLAPMWAYVARPEVHG